MAIFRYQAAAALSDRGKSRARVRRVSSINRGGNRLPIVFGCWQL